MDNTMFCYQCEQTARGTGCVSIGMCGKDATVSALQDLLVYQLEGLSFYGNEILTGGGSLKPDVHFFVIEALFATLTNVSFDPERFMVYLRRSQGVKLALRAQAGNLTGPVPAAASYILPEGEEDYPGGCLACGHPAPGQSRCGPAVAQRHPALCRQGHGGLRLSCLAAGIPRRNRQ